MSQENVELARRYFEAFNATGIQGTEDLYLSREDALEAAGVSE